MFITVLFILEKIVDLEHPPIVIFKYIWHVLTVNIAINNQVVGDGGNVEANDLMTWEKGNKITYPE